MECCKLSRGQLADQGAISESSTKGACAVVCVRVFKRLPALRVRRGCASVGVAQLSEFIALSGVWPRPTLHKLIPILTAYFSIRSLAVLWGRVLATFLRATPSPFSPACLALSPIFFFLLLFSFYFPPQPLIFGPTCFPTSPAPSPTSIHIPSCSFSSFCDTRLFLLPALASLRTSLSPVSSLASTFSSNKLSRTFGSPAASPR